jgi:hypothetical protein
MKKCLFGILCSALLVSAMSVVPSGASAAADESISPLEPNPNKHVRTVVNSKHYKLVADIDAQLFTVLRQDENGKYTIIDRQMICSTAKPPKRTRTGSFKILKKASWLLSKKNELHPDLYLQFACHIHEEARLWIHSTSFFKRNSNTLDEESYRMLGNPASAGCIRLCVRDALWIYANCPVGTAVEIVKGGGPPALCPGELPPLPEGATYDPTDPAVLG